MKRDAYLVIGLIHLSFGMMIVGVIAVLMMNTTAYVIAQLIWLAIMWWILKRAYPD